MALINCPECNNQVSNTAASCPNCGAAVSAVETATIDASITTTQGTSKKLKLQSVISATLFWIGLIGSIFAMQAENQNSIFYIVVLVGIVWHIITKTRMWWNHD